MKIVRFLGGLGNQMFQYAFYAALSQRFKHVKADIAGFKGYHLHNGFEMESIFKVKLKYASNFEVGLLDTQNRQWKYRKMRRLLFVRGGYYEERDLFSYDENLLNDASSLLLWGYWQNWRYVESVAERLRNEFVFPAASTPDNRSLLRELEQQESSVAIHVRRGDYLENPYLGGLVDVNYFRKGVSMIRNMVNNPRFYVFSDDVTWCKENLGLAEEALFVDWNRGDESYRDMQLMANCKHAIISNSSFSWWGAWLIENQSKKIIVPQLWYRAHGISTDDMHPTTWIRI